MPKKKNTKTKAAPVPSRAGRPTDRSAVITELFRLFPTKRYTIKALAAASGGADRDGRGLTGEIVR